VGREVGRRRMESGGSGRGRWLCEMKGVLEFGGGLGGYCHETEVHESRLSNSSLFEVQAILFLDVWYRSILRARDG
jgi:hypothetical protein